MAERHGCRLLPSEGMGLGGQPRWLIYGFAITIALSVLALRMLAIPLELSRQPLMILFMLPIILSAIGGLGPELLATALLGFLGIDLLA